METTVKYKVSSDHFNIDNVNEFTAITMKTIEQIKEFATQNDYKIKMNINFPDGLLLEKNIRDGLNNLSRKQKKVLRNYIYAIGKKITLNNANRFLHKLLKVALLSDLRIKITKSDKELLIQEKRKAYMDAIAVARKAHAEYKAEKGDFYKLRLEKKQCI